MDETIRVGAVLRAGAWAEPATDHVVLDYEARFLRRKRLIARSGHAVMVDLPETVSLNHGDALEAADGGLVAVEAAVEPVLKITGDLARLAWHIGNRHTPCQIMPDHLVIRQDHVLADMLTRLGAGLEATEAPFTPEGGAYGHGRTHGHSHGPENAHGSSHGHGHDTGDATEAGDERHGAGI